MSRTHHPGSVGLEILTGGVLGTVTGLLLIPLFAVFSPLCLWHGQAGVCGGLSAGLFWLFDLYALPVWRELLVLLAVAVTAAVGFVLRTR